MEQTECSETSAYKIQTPWSNPEESIQQSEICLIGSKIFIIITKRSAIEFTTKYFTFPFFS